MPRLSRQTGPQNLLQYLEPHTRRFQGLNKLMKMLGGETPGPVFGGEDIQSDPGMEAMNMVGPMITRASELMGKLGKRGLDRIYDDLINALPRKSQDMKAVQELTKDTQGPKASFQGIMDEASVMAPHSQEAADIVRTPRNRRLERLFNKGERELPPAGRSRLPSGHLREDAESFLQPRPDRYAEYRTSYPEFAEELERGAPGQIESSVTWPSRSIGASPQEDNFIYSEARDWLRDIQSENDPMNLDDIPNEHIRQLVERHFDGGWDEFLRTF